MKGGNRVLCRFLYFALLLRRKAYGTSPEVCDPHLDLYKSHWSIEQLKGHRAMQLVLGRILPVHPHPAGFRRLEITGITEKEWHSQAMEEYWVGYRTVFTILPLVSR